MSALEKSKGRVELFDELAAKLNEVGYTIMQIKFVAS